MERLSHILPKITRKRELDSNALASEILLEAEKYLRDIFGEQNIGRGKKICAKKIQNQFLFCDVASSAWNNRLFLEKMELLEHLHKTFPKAAIADIRGMVK
ncbi:DUF721 domain-containing protein [Candidatus Peregrinibacteria bacterium]|nr:DUF721 domain-containing protein [Candidatus Peregrinibacteria bacterium]